MGPNELADFEARTFRQWDRASLGELPRAIERRRKELAACEAPPPLVRRGVAMAQPRVVLAPTFFLVLHYHRAQIRAHSPLGVTMIRAACSWLVAVGLLCDCRGPGPARPSRGEASSTSARSRTEWKTSSVSG